MFVIAYLWCVDTTCTTTVLLTSTTWPPTEYCTPFPTLLQYASAMSLQVSRRTAHRFDGVRVPDVAHLHAGETRVVAQHGPKAHELDGARACSRGEEGMGAIPRCSVGRSMAHRGLQTYSRLGTRTGSKC